MQSLHARHALLPSGWASDVRLQIANGRFAVVETGVAATETDEKLGIVIPGLVNAHSHAFQRLLVGHAEQPSPDGADDFWGWRERMYRLAQNIEPDMLYAIACQLFCEMLTSGYTAVVEFHYLHNGPGAGIAGDDMSRAVMHAAGDSGIRLLHVPILYERSGFGSDQPGERQRLFTRTVDDLLRLYENLQQYTSAHVALGLGVHSLRAVTPASIDVIVQRARADDVPFHIHVAEQQREVDECLAATGSRPVQWLLDNHDVDHRWCLVHATHMDDDETRELAQTGAVVCLCPSTEANLGDGIFPAPQYVAAGGRLAVGSDSQVTVDPFEELRWLEYVQRLQLTRRNIIRSTEHSHSGDFLYRLALDGGAHAIGSSSGALAVDHLADLLVLDDAQPLMLGHTTDSYLDAVVFGGFATPIARVMVHGLWQVTQGEHRLAEQTRENFATTVRRLEARINAG